MRRLYVTVLWWFWAVSLSHADHIAYIKVDDTRPASVTSMNLGMQYLHKGIYMLKEQLKLMANNKLTLSAEIKDILGLSGTQQRSADELNGLFIAYAISHAGSEHATNRAKLVKLICENERSYLSQAAEAWKQFLQTDQLKPAPSQMAKKLFVPCFNSLEVDVVRKMIYIYRDTYLFIFSYKSAYIDGEESIQTSGGYIFGFGTKTTDMTVVHHLDWLSTIVSMQSLDPPETVAHLGLDPAYCHAILVAGTAKTGSGRSYIFSYIIGDILSRRKFKFIANLVMDEKPDAYYIWKKEQVLIFVYRKPRTTTLFVRLRDIMDLLLESCTKTETRVQLGKSMSHLTWSLHRNIYSDETVPVARVTFEAGSALSVMPPLCARAEFLKNLGHSNILDQRNGLLFNFGIYGNIHVVDVKMSTPRPVLIIRGAPTISRDHVFMSPFQSSKDKTQFIVIAVDVVYSLELPIGLVLNEDGTGVSEQVRSAASTEIREAFFSMGGQFEMITRCEAPSSSSAFEKNEEEPFTPHPPIAGKAPLERDTYIYEAVKPLFYQDPWLCDTSQALTSSTIMIPVGRRASTASEHTVHHMLFIDLEKRYLYKTDPFSSAVRYSVYSSTDRVLFYFDTSAQRLHGIIYNTLMVEHSYQEKRKKADARQHKLLKAQENRIRQACQQRADQREQREQAKQKHVLASQRRLQHISLFVYSILFYVF